MERPCNAARAALIALLSFGMGTLVGCGGKAPEVPPAAQAEPLPVESAPPHSTFAPAVKPLRSFSLPDYFPNDHALLPGNGFSYLEVRNAEGQVIELHAFSSGGNARNKVVFTYKNGRLDRQLEFSFGSESDNMLEKEYRWQGDTATWTLSDRNREILIVDRQHRVVERTLGILAMPYAYLHIDYDSLGRAARVDRFYKTDTSHEVLQTRYDYGQAEEPWMQRTALVYAHSFPRTRFRDWRTLKEFIRNPAFEAGPFATKEPYQKVVERRTEE